MTYSVPRKILVTGARGNLGRKVVDHLAQQDWCYSVLGAVTAGASALPVSESPKVTFVECDLRLLDKIRSAGLVDGIDAIVHFAAQRPVVEATWEDSAASYDMTQNLLTASVAAGVRRFVFASSNHVMGRYKDSPLADALAPGGITAEVMPAPGTLVDAGDVKTDSTPYASGKLFTERACVAKAEETGGALSTVSVRIGWCQPGINLPQTINISGGAADDAPEPTGEDEIRALRWYRNMWLSNRDFLQLMERAVLADHAAWPAAGIVVNGMSANAGMGWDLSSANQHLGYAAQDDIWSHV